MCVCACVRVCVCGGGRGRCQWHGHAEWILMRCEVEQKRQLNNLFHICGIIIFFFNSVAALLCFVLVFHLAAYFCSSKKKIGPKRKWICAGKKIAVVIFIFSFEKWFRLLKLFPICGWSRCNQLFTAAVKLHQFVSHARSADEKNCTIDEIVSKRFLPIRPKLSNWLESMQQFRKIRKKSKDFCHRNKDGIFSNQFLFFEQIDQILIYSSKIDDTGYSMFWKIRSFSLF